jgi:hypothetical protein
VESRRVTEELFAHGKERIREVITEDFSALSPESEFCGIEATKTSTYIPIHELHPSAANFITAPEYTCDSHTPNKMAQAIAQLISVLGKWSMCISTILTEASCDRGSVAGKNRNNASN